MGECQEATIQAVPSLWATDHLGVASEGACASGTRGRTGSASLSPAGVQRQARPRVVAGGLVLPLAMRLRALPRRCPPQTEPSAPGSGEASVFPTPVARGAREQPPDAPRRLEGEGLGLGEWGALGGRAAAARALRGREDGGDRPSRPGTRGAVRSAPEPASPAAEGGTAGAPARQAARAAAGFSASASRAPGKPPPARPPPPHRRRGVRNELTELRSPIRGALDAGSRPLRGCKLVGSAPLARSLLTIRFGDWAGSGGVGRRERAAAVLPLGASEWGPGSGGDGS